MKSLIKILLLGLLTANFILAQDEFVVNTYQDSTQRDPQIERDSEGNYAVVWNSDYQVSYQDEGEIMLQLFNSDDEKVGEEEFVNTDTDNDQERPALAINSEGTFVVVWASKSNDFESIYDIKGRIYKNNEPIGDEFLINTTTANSQSKPDVAIDENGNIVVVWESWYQDGSNKGVYGQMLDSQGNKVGGEFQVNSETEFSQAKPAVKYLENGNFIVVWESWKQDVATPVGYGIYGKIFASYDDVVKDEFQINTYTNDYQWFSDLETFGNEFIVAWCSWEQDGYDGGIYMQKFDQSGGKIGNEVMVNSMTAYYQWLPRLKKTADDKFAVVWSSWQQDGSMEGVYSKIYNTDMKELTFETRINQYTESFQWEPDFIPKSDFEILVVYSSWGINNNGYEVTARRVVPDEKQGSILNSAYEHTAGMTTAGFKVLVNDSTNLTGDTYEINFEKVDNIYQADITNKNSGIEIISDFKFDDAEEYYYITPFFDGVAVEFFPEFDLSIDTDKSYFVNNSGTNIEFNLGKPTGTTVIAPIDMILIWGNTDTLADGSYAEPLDSAYSITGQKSVKCPFMAWNVTDEEQMEMFVSERNSSENNRWDPGEHIGFLTPPQYQDNFPNFHAQLNTYQPDDELKFPAEGDTNYIFTTRPIKEEDVFTFTTSKSYLTEVENDYSVPDKFALKQNYPNPFNPSTTIVYKVPEASKVKLTVFNVLGQKIAKLIDKLHKKGTYKIMFDASEMKGGLASGVYIYSMQADKKILSRKMLLLK
jgi:hypothetical protein